MTTFGSNDQESPASRGQGGDAADRPFRVLSLDGGGIRGVYTAAYLYRLQRLFSNVESRDELDVGAGFDLIAGTSTGAIVGCGLAKGISLQKIIALYRDYAKLIFPHHISGIPSAIYHAARGGSFARRGNRALKCALTEVFKTTTIADVFRDRGIALSIPAVLMSQHRAYVFKKTLTSGNRDDHFSLVDVCLATTAAPIYRSFASVVDPHEPNGPPLIFADGGLWANNPVLVGMIDALLSAPEGRPIQIYSLGTCARPEGEQIRAFELDRGMLSWWLGAKISPLSISAQEFAFDNMARMLARILSDTGRPVRRLRFPKTSIPGNILKYLDLDDSRAEAIEALIAQARNDADMTKSACDDPANGDGQLIRELMMSLGKLSDSTP